MKKIISLFLVMALLVTMTVVFVPSASAVSKPGKPTVVAYDCAYAIDGAELIFKKPSGGAVGYHIQVMDLNMKVVANAYAKSSAFKKITAGIYKGSYVNTNMHLWKKIKAGKWYTVRVRGFNISNSSYTYSSGKPSYAVYGAYSGVTYAACDVTNLKVSSPHKNSLKASWSKVAGTTSYKMEVNCQDKNRKSLIVRHVSTSSNGFHIAIPEETKYITILVWLKKNVGNKTYVSDSSSSYHKFKR